MTTGRARSLGVLVACLVPLGVWMGCFSLVYAIHTVACLADDAPPRWLAPSVTATVAAALAALVVAWLRLRRRAAEEGTWQGFTARLSVDLTLLAFVGLAWIAGVAAIPFCRPF